MIKNRFHVFLFNLYLLKVLSLICDTKSQFILSGLVYKPHPRFLAQNLSKKGQLIHESLRYWAPDNLYKLCRRTGTEPITQQVRRKRWKWIGHVLHMPPAALPQVALRWTPDGRRKRDRPKQTWRKTVEKEMKENSWTWGHLERRAL